MDFLHDQLFDARKIRILAVIDQYSRFSPALDPRFSYRATDVVGTLDRAAVVPAIPNDPSAATRPASTAASSFLSPRVSSYRAFNLVASDTDMPLKVKHPPPGSRPPAYAARRLLNLLLHVRPMMNGLSLKTEARKGNANTNLFLRYQIKANTCRVPGHHHARYRGLIELERQRTVRAKVHRW